MSVGIDVCSTHSSLSCPYTPTYPCRWLARDTRAPRRLRNTPIGSRIARRTRLASSCTEAEEWVLTSEERRVVGVALCLGGEDVYYISLNAVASAVPLEERLGLLETVVNGSPWLTSLRIFDFKEQMK
ncbi:unnamed protein product, partial [Timema podura]|nr:unnamed protein product [Timema podura]